MLHARFLGAISLIHEATEKLGPPFSTGEAADVAIGVIREVYGGYPSFTFGRPGRPHEEELEEYALMDAAHLQLMLWEIEGNRALRRGEG